MKCFKGKYRTHICEMTECAFFFSDVGLVISVSISYSKWMYRLFFTSNRRVQKVAYKGFHYTKDRDTNTDTGVKIYWRCENRKCKHFFFCTNQFSTKLRLNFDEFSTNCRSRPYVVVGETSYRQNVAFDQTLCRRNAFRPTVMDP